MILFNLLNCCWCIAYTCVDSIMWHTLITLPLLIDERLDFGARMKEILTDYLCCYSVTQVGEIAPRDPFSPILLDGTANFGVVATFCLSST